MKISLEKRMSECFLALHPDKTKIVYCKDEDRRLNFPVTKFDFLGFTFRARRSKNRWGKYFMNFSPAVSDKAQKNIRAEVRRWKLKHLSHRSLDELARMFNSKILGWLEYYGTF